MKHLVYVFALALTLLFAACGDDDSSSFVEPEKESSDSGATLSGDSHEVSSPSSCSSKDDKSSSSVSSSSTNSSSSAKSSSSTDSKSSSSVTSSSSGGDDFLTLLVEDPIACDDEGEYSEIVYERVPYRVLCQNGFLVYAPQSSSSSSSVKSSSSYFDMSNQYNDAKWITYGTFVDPRDNQEYRTIEVTDKSIKTMQYVIMSSNLNYGKMVTTEMATNSDGTVEKFCYNDDPWYCENGFGGLYTWSEALGLPRACDTVALGSTPECPEATGFGESGRRQGICPEGWHVMNEFEWRGMPTSEGFGADPMLSKVFDGDDDIGLAVLLGGGYYRGKYDGLGINIDFWVVEESSNKEYASTFANTTGVSAYSSIKVNFSDIELKLSKLPVRCVKDY